MRAVVESRSALIALAFALGMTGAAQATMPVNPDRPLSRQTCAEARARLREALRRNPLLDEAGDRAARERARLVKRRLCGPAPFPR